MRKDLTEHLEKDCPNRDYKCVYCEEKGTYANITGIHDKICDQKPVPCPNAECSEAIQRCGMKRHLGECDYQNELCKYTRLGCDQIMKRKDMVVHKNDDKYHLHMALDTITKSEDRRHSLSNGKCMTFKLTEYQKKKENNERFNSFPVYTSLSGYRMTILVCAYGCNDHKGTHVSVYAEILKGKYDTELKWPFTGCITITLLNQLEDENHYTRMIDVMTTDNVHVGHGLGYSNFISHSDLRYKLQEWVMTQYLKDDTLFFRVSVDANTTHKPWLECTKNSSCIVLP